MGTPGQEKRKKIHTLNICDCVAEMNRGERTPFFRGEGGDRVAHSVLDRDGRISGRTRGCTWAETLR